MLRRSTKIQLILFVVITLLGISYVSAEYVGLTKSLFGNQCTISANFPDSGGIFTNAEVTYRGVTVGKVGPLRLRKNGVGVDLVLEDCTSPKIPASTSAVVADRSVVGEQYVDLVPVEGKAPYGTGGPYDENGPYLKAGSVIPMDHTKIPIASETLLRNLNSLIQSVPLNDLRTTVDELGKAFNGRGEDLGSLLDSTNTLLTAAQQNLPQTIALINNSATVLSTQLDETDALKSWTHSLKLISAQLKKSDPDIRRLLNSGPGDLDTVRTFVNDNKTDIGVTLANVAVVGDLIVRHLNGVEQVFELYPALAAGGQSVLHDNRGALGLVLQTPTKLSLSQPDLGNDPPDCGDPKQARQGYDGTRRLPSDLSPAAPNVAARCTAPVSSGTNVRGSANIPGGDPISVSGGGYAYPRAATDNTIQVGTTLTSSKLGDGSWLALLTDGLH